MSKPSALKAFVGPLTVLALLFALLAYAGTLHGGHPDGGVFALFLYVAVVLPIGSLIGLTLSIRAYRKSPQFKGFGVALGLIYGLGLVPPCILYLWLLLFPGRPV